MQHEKLRYQPNKLSQLLVMGGMIFMVFALFKVINVYRYTNQSVAGIILPDIFVGIEILIAIFVMLASFLLGEKFKSYDRKWLPVGVALTIYPLVKIFIYPIKLYEKFNELITSGQIVSFKTPIWMKLVNKILELFKMETRMVYDSKTWLIIVISALVLSSVLYFLGTLTSYKKTNRLEAYYKEAGLEHGE